jgi:type I restriction enzyme, S subunit
MPENTIIFVVRGMSLKTEFRIGISRKPVAFGQDCKALIPKNGIDPWYLAYAIRAKSQDILGLVDEAGHGTGRLQTDALKQLEIPIPPFEEQERIAKSIRLLDDKIDLVRQMNRTLELVAWAVFRQWFVESDGVRNWETGTISDFAQITSGKRPDSRKDEATAEYKYPLFGGGGIMAYANKYLYNFPILLTGRVGTLGIIFRISDPCWASDNTLVLISSKPEYYFYLYFHLKQSDLKVLNRGSTQPLLTQSDLQKIEMPLPPEKLMIEFTHMASHIFAKIDANEKESRTLASLRDSLLPKLMRGEVRVKS